MESTWGLRLVVRAAGLLAILIAFLIYPTVDVVAVWALGLIGALVVMVS